VGELVDIATEGTPQGPLTTMEPMEESNLNEEDIMTILTIEHMEVEERGPWRKKEGRSLL